MMATCGCAARAYSRGRAPSHRGSDEFGVCALLGGPGVGRLAEGWFRGARSRLLASRQHGECAAACGRGALSPGPAQRGGRPAPEGAGPHRGAASDPRPRLTTPAPASAGPRFPTVPRKIQSGQSRKLGLAGSCHRQWTRTLRARVHTRPESRSDSDHKEVQ